MEVTTFLGVNKLQNMEFMKLIFFPNEGKFLVDSKNAIKIEENVLCV